MSWKDSLNVPVSSQGEWTAKRFYGDPQLAAAYLPVAYALLGSVKNRMAYGGVGYGHQQIELPDGTRIRVLRNGNQNIIEIATSRQAKEEELILLCKFYLESGVVTSTFPGASFPENTTPGKLYRASFDNEPAPINPDTKKEQPKIQFLGMPANGEFSYALGHEVFYLPGKTQSEKEAVALALYNKVRAAARIPSSLYTGKLQLLIQAHLGRRFVPEVDGISGAYLEDTAQPDHFVLHGGELNWFWPASLGLVTDTERLRYFIVRFGTSSLVCYPVNISECARKLADYMLENSQAINTAEWKRYEAYILSTSAINYDNPYGLEDFASPIEGDPMGGYHSWALNWEGSEARVVTHNLEEVPGQPNVFWYVARHYKISFSINPAYYADYEEESDRPSPLNYELSLLKTVEYFPHGTLAVWYFNYGIVNKLQCFLPPAGVQYNAVYPPSWPIYVFFDSQDRVIESCFLYDSSPITPMNTWPYVSGYCSNGGLTISYSGKRILSGNELLELGFSVRDVEYTTVGETKEVIHRTLQTIAGEQSVTQVVRQSNEAAAFGSSGCYTEGTALTSPGLWTQTAVYMTAEERDDKRTSQGRQNCFIIPFGDVSSVYVGVRKNTRNEQRIKSGSAWHVYTREYEDSWGGHINSWHFMSLQVMFASNQVVQATTIDEIETNFAFIDRYTTYDLGDGSGGIDDLLVRPLVADPFFEPPVRVSHGLSNDVVYNNPPGSKIYSWDYGGEKESDIFFIGWSGIDN